MMTTISALGKTYDFSFSHSAQCWTGHMDFEKNDICLEIYLEDLINPIDWHLVEQFYLFTFQEVDAPSIIEKSNDLLMKYIEVVRFGISGSLDQYYFKLKGISYKDRKWSPVFGQQTYHYSLLFNLFNKKYVECDDPYGLYYVDIDNALIQGIRRVQV